MSAEIRERLPHSAEVHMELRVNGHTMTISHMGPGYVVVDDPIDQPPAEAELVMSVDAEVSRWPVYLVAGVSSSVPRIPLARRP